MNKKVVSILVCISIMLTFLFSNISASTVSDLNQKLKDLNEKMADTSEKLDNTKDEKKDAENKKEQIDNDINYTNQKINATQNRINELDKRLSTKQNQLEKAKARLDEQMEMYQQRMRANYKKGSVSVLEMLFGSGSFVEFIINLDNAKRIAQYDKKLISEMTAEKQKINEALVEIEMNKKEKEQAKQTLDSEKSNLDNKLLKAENYVNELNSDIEKLKKEYARYEKEEKKVQTQIENLLSQSDGDYVGGEFIWPIPGYRNITSPYGMRKHPITGKYKLHTGTDIGAPRGTRIIAANGGKVVTATYNYAYGNYVIIDHGGGKATLYAHCNSLAVSKGQTVKKGQTVGYVGDSGYATGCHLHFEIRIKGKTVNPMSYFGR